MAKKEQIKSIFQKKKGSVDFWLLIASLLLLAIGLVMVLSASSPTSLSETGNDSYKYFNKQMEFAIIGVIAMFIISKYFNYKVLQKYYFVFYVVSVILLLLVAVPHIGSTAGGAKRWLNLGIRFQPSELTKILLIIAYAGYFTKFKDRLHEFKIGFLIPVISLGIVAAILFILQNHLSATIIIVSVVFFMMIMAGTNKKYFVVPGIPMAALVAGAFLLREMGKSDGSFRLKRIFTFLNPEQDIKGSGWQIMQSKYAIGSGGFWGVGLGQSKQKYLYLSEPHTDFIFAIVAEELGFLGCIIIIALFAMFIARGLGVAANCKDRFGSLVAFGITMLVAVQVILNIAVVTASMPVTGVPLPFFSYGGTSLLILLCSVGILLNISRENEK